MKKLTNMQQVSNKKFCSGAMIAIDWSLLMPELLHDIYTKLAEIRDFIRFRAVCKAWRSSVSLSNPSPYCLPWILFSRHSENGDLQFYSIFSDKIYNIHMPQASGTRILGSTKGYLVGYKYSDDSLSLLNPFTANHIPLPSLKEEIRHPFLCKVAMIPERSTEDQIIILGRDRSQTLLLKIYQKTGAHWIGTRLNSNFAKSVVWAYYNGMYFVGDPSKEHTGVFDAITGIVVSTIPDFKKNNAVKVSEYLVESGGKLLRILINNYRHTGQLSLDVYALINVENGYRWLEIKDIDNHILFLDRFGAFSLTSSKCYGVRGNCIYFFSHLVKMNNEEERCFLRRYELGNGTIETSPHPFNSCGTWIIPSIC